jgi:hypothetical protein
MKKVFIVIPGLIMFFCMSACQASQPQSTIPATLPVKIVETSTALPPVTPDSTDSTTSGTIVSPDTSSTLDAAQIQAIVGYSIREPGTLPDGYVLDKATVDEQTRSVCLQYRHTEVSDDVLFIAQGPVEKAPPLEMVPGWPDYSIKKEAIQIDGADNGFRISGWRRSSWACSEAAQAEKTPYSFALAPKLTWEVDRQQFDLYSANGGCGTAGGLTNLDIIRVAEGLMRKSTHPADELDPECLHSIADVEKLAGFDVKEPAYMPEDVSFYFATFEKEPSPSVILYYYNKQHRDMGTFFNISQDVKASPVFMTSCTGSTGSTCEMLKIGTIPVVYLNSGQTEQMDWYSDGLYSSLFRNAGEPGKVYKDELIKIVESMK